MQRLTILLAALCMVALAGNTGTAVSAVPAQELGIRSITFTSDMIGPAHQGSAPAIEPGMDLPAFPEAWNFALTGFPQALYTLGVAVKNDELWVSSGGGGASPAVISLYDLSNPLHPLITRFNQPWSTTSWGMGDMAYSPVRDEIYAGILMETRHIVVVDGTSHILKVSAYPAFPFPTWPLAMGRDANDSLYTANFNTNPCKLFAAAPWNPRVWPNYQPSGHSMFGYAVDLAGGKFWMYDEAVSDPEKLVCYDFPSMTNMRKYLVTGASTNGGGCEMWGTDYLIVLDQATPDDIVRCLQVVASGHDIAMTDIERPTFFGEFPESFQPRAQATNQGANAENNFDIQCQIYDDILNLVYDETFTVTTAIAPGTSVWIDFPATTLSIGDDYEAVITSLLSDDEPSNDEIARVFPVNTTLECYWDDLDPASPGNGWAWYAAGGAWLHAFPNYWGEIQIVTTKIALYTSDWPIPGGNGYIAFVTDNTGTAGAPGTELYNSGTLTGTRGAWNLHDLTAPLTYTADRWYVGYEQVVAYPNCPGLAIDAGVDGPGWAHWERYLGTYTNVNKGGDWGLRCFISKEPSVVHDVGATAILAPAATVMLDDVVWPEVTVENYGEVEETFNVQVTIEDETDAIVFQEEEQVVALGIGESRDVTFATYSWTATPVGNYTVTATTMLAGDVDPNNDEVGPEDFVVTDALHDVGATAVLTPAGAEFLDDVLWPEVTVENFGEAVETFMVEVLIEDETDAIVFQQEEQVVALGIGESRDFTFATYSWTATPEGNYTVTATTKLVGDATPGNDVYGPEAFTVTEAAPWPERWTETSSHIPTANSGRNVKRGGWLALGPNGNFYLAKGYKTGDFYRYDPMGDSFSTLTDILEGAEGKLPEKGCRGISDGVNSIYMTKGNNTLGFWRYDITAKTWAPLTDVPAGAGKKVKGGTDLIYYNPPDDTGYVYMLKGYKTEFWRYNTGTGMWEARANAPTGIKDKWDKGSWLAFDGENTIYAHKAKYYTGSEHEFYRYNIERDSWSTLLNGMPLYGMHSGKPGKKKKAKDGGAGAYYADGGAEGQIYALKGGNTQQFFMYDVAADTWTEKDTIPTNGSTGKKRRVKVGGDFVYWGRNAFFAMKGNKTQEMWRYVIPAMPMRTDRGGVMAGTVKGLRTGMTVGPNPVVGGFATLRYSLPKAGPATVNVFDVAGRGVLSRSVLATRSGAVSLDLRSMSAGIYLVRVEAEGFTGTQKLVIQH